MKKIFISALLATAVLNAGAQDMYDALRYSDNNYQGTARTMAMGNAFTALGSDLGSVGLNPAGSAVAGYSQATITPGVSIVTSNSMGTDSDYCFGNGGSGTMARFSIPNIGFNLNISTKRSRGIKSHSLGFSSNITNSFLDDTYASGQHYGTSYAGYLAASATGSGFTASMLDRKDAYDLYPTPLVLGWKSGLINYVDGDEGLFCGVTEQFTKDDDGYHFNVGGPLRQKFGRQVTGNKADYVFNYAINVSDKLYLGINLGITSFNYRYDDFFNETAVDPKDFVIDYGDKGTTYFNALKYNYAYDAQGDGLYGKIGFIWKPSQFIRIGAAIQTPTLMTVDEFWSTSAETYMTDVKFDASSASPEWSYRYLLRTPSRYNAGVAAVIGKYGVISVDYEGSNYGEMRFKEYEGYAEEYFEVNQDIKTFMKWQNNVRVGLEMKPVQCFAVRGGFNFSDTPERYFDENRRLVSPGANRLGWSFGFGYSDKGSFFADAAAKVTTYPDEFIQPYGDYTGDAKLPSPEIVTRKNIWTAALTIGWRF